MNAFTDDLGTELTHWPIAHLINGGISEPMIINFQTPFAGHLRAVGSDKLKVWAKWMKFPQGAYIDISENQGINLDGVQENEGRFEIYVESLGPTTAVERLYAAVVLAKNSPAGWFS